MDSITVALMGWAHWLEYGVTLLLAALLVSVVLRRGAFSVMSMRMWWCISVGWQVFFATVITIAQYRMWNANDITRELITTPLGEEVPRMIIHAPISLFLDGRGGYYVFYAYTHFWVSLLLSAFGALVFYGFFRVLQRRKPVAVGHEEVLLVSGMAFLTGWPNMIAFISLAFVFAVADTLWAHIRKGAAARTRMLRSVIFAAITTLLLSAKVAAYTALLTV